MKPNVEVSTHWQLPANPTRERRVILVTLSMRTVSEANSHEHWRLRAKRAKQQREAAAFTLLGVLRAEHVEPPCDVLLTRIGPTTGLDDDNLPASMKHVRDGVADALGLANDRDPRVRWSYAQQRTKDWGVIVRIVKP